MQEKALFDADAEQRVLLSIEKRGKLYTVAHIFAPITDEEFLAYERAFKTRVTGAKDTGDADAVEVKDEAFNASLALWDSKVIRIEGYGLKSGGDVSAIDWKSKVSAGDKVFAIDSGLMATDIAPLPSADDGELLPLDDDDDSATVRLRCIFQGAELITEHVLRTPNAEEMARYNAIMKRKVLIRGQRLGKTDRSIPSRAKGLVSLYDSVQVSASGYAGRVPFHHKYSVALHHFGAEQEVVTKN